MQVDMDGYEDEMPEYESDAEGEQPSDLPAWSHSFDEGPPRLTEEELERADVVSRSKEIEAVDEEECSERTWF